MVDMPVASAEDSKGGTAWLRSCANYCRKWVKSNKIPSDPVPVVWIGAPHGGLRGSINQKWDIAACGVVSGDGWWIDYALSRYDQEVKLGHQLQETLTASHAWQHLMAHAAIRTAIRHNPILATTAGPAKLAALKAANDLWWSHESWLMKTFWVPAVKGMVTPGARYQFSGRSSHRDAIAAFVVGASPTIKVPKLSRILKYADTYCQELMEDLRAEGDKWYADPHEPHLYSPVYRMQKGADVYTYWKPPQDVWVNNQPPVLYAKCVNGKDTYDTTGLVAHEPGSYIAYGT